MDVINTDAIMKETLNKYLMKNSHLTTSEREVILSCFSALKIKKNEYWVRKGEICRHLAFVNNGILRVIHETHETESTVQLIFQQTFATSLTSFAYQVPGIWSIQALIDCELLVIDRDNHFRLIEKYKNWLEIDNVLLLTAYTELENRLFTQVHLPAEQRFNQLFAEKREIFNQIPLKHIASLLGITPETLSRLRKKHLS